MIVEAKKLGTPLQTAVQQAINYCIIDGFRYFAVTDGQHWQLYNTHHPGPLSDKLVMGLDVTGSAAQTCLDALALWRPAAVTGEIKPAAVPLMQPSAAVEPQPHTALPHTDVTSDETISDDLAQVIGVHAAARIEAAGDSIAVRGCADSCQLGGSDCGGGALAARSRPLEQITPADSTGHEDVRCRFHPATSRQEQRSEAARQVGPHFVNVHYSATDHVRNIGWIVKLTGQDPAEFAVRLAN